jgi:hypothetical protein
MEFVGSYKIDTSQDLVTESLLVWEFPLVKARALQLISCKSDIGKPRYWRPGMSSSDAIHRANVWPSGNGLVTILQVLKNSYVGLQ